MGVSVELEGLGPAESAATVPDGDADGGGEDDAAEEAATAG